MESAGRQTVHVIGGLGNQLFQYLFGEVIARRAGRETIYDTTGFDTYRLHEGLGISRTFDLKLNQLQRKSGRSLLSQLNLLQKLARRSPLAAKVMGARTDHTFTLGQDEIVSGYYLGYWQSQPYSDDDLRSVIATLRFRPEFIETSRALLRDVGLTSNQVAAVHVRRGDFLRARPPAPHYPLPLDYYVEAMDALVREAGVRHFVIASDDPEWVDRFLASRFPSTNLGKAFGRSGSHDLCALSTIPHKILSNSTFGWWAAALGSQDGLVIAPRQWSRPGVPHEDINTPLRPASWRLLDIL